MNSPPRVAIDVTPLAAIQTGIGRSVADLLRALADLDDAPLVRPYAISTRARREREQLPENTVIIPGAGALASMWARADRPRIDRSLDGATVLHATNYLIPPSKLPTLATINDCSLVRHRSFCTPAVQALEPVVRRAIERGVSIHVPSQFVADEVEDIYGPRLAANGRLHVVAYGVPAVSPAGPLPAEIARFSPFAERRPFLLSIGTLEPRKNHAHLIAAFGEVASSDADLWLVLAGPDGIARPEIDATIQRLPATIAERVVLTGPISEPSKSWLLRNAEALCFPSVYEGFGFPILEAMSVGTPAIAARAGSLPEIGADAVAYVDATDETTIIAAVTKVRSDDAERARLVRRGIERSSEFSWHRCAQTINDCYQQLDS